MKNSIQYCTVISQYGCPRYILVVCRILRTKNKYVLVDRIVLPLCVIHVSLLSLFTLHCNNDYIHQQTQPISINTAEGWPSGLRRNVKAVVFIGVGSNPIPFSFSFLYYIYMYMNMVQSVCIFYFFKYCVVTMLILNICITLFL